MRRDRLRALRVQHQNTKAGDHPGQLGGLTLEEGDELFDEIERLREKGVKLVEDKVELMSVRNCHEALCVALMAYLADLGYDNNFDEWLFSEGTPDGLDRETIERATKSLDKLRRERKL